MSLSPSSILDIGTDTDTKTHNDLLFKQDSLSQLDLGTDTDAKPDNDLLLKQDSPSPHCVRSVIVHLLAPRFFQPNAFRAREPVYFQLNVPDWRVYLTGYEDRIVADFLEFGCPIHYAASVIPTPTRKNHQFALAHPDHVEHYLHTELTLGEITGPFSCNPLDQDLFYVTFANSSQTWIHKASCCDGLELTLFSVCQ